MAGQSKTVQAQPADDVRNKRKHDIVKGVKVATFLSVCQHVISLQSEPMLLDQAFNGDLQRSLKLLGASSGAVGILSLFFNQIGGKLSDSVGRKPGCLVGPLGNVFLGLLVYLRSTSPSVIIVARVLRMVITTFSNTVINNALLSDVLSGDELTQVGAEIGAIVGVAVTLTPFVEGTILARTKSPRISFLLLSALALLQFAYVSTSTEETLEVQNRRPLGADLSLSLLNPLGFMKIYTKGSISLKKIITLITLQSFIEGKNLSDFAITFMKQNMNWGVTGIRNWVAFYGFANVVSGFTLTPYLLKRLSVAEYTQFTNMTNIIAYTVRAFVEARDWLYVGTMPLMLPGVNGASSAALHSVAFRHAIADGFGKGEFSAYSNNIRAIVSAIAPVILTRAYAYTQPRGFGGSPYWIVMIVAGIIPTLMFRSVTEDELNPS